MINAKQTSDLYDQTRSLLKKKLQPLFDEKNDKRNAIRKVFDKPEEQGERKKLEKTKRQELNQSFREENKNLIEKYQESFKENKLNEEKFQKALKVFQELNPDLQEKDVRIMIMWDKESKEKEKKIPQFEDKNHRETSNETWKIKEEKANIWNGEKYETKKIKVKISPEWDIKEYVSWVPSNLIGQQLFSKKALTRLWLLNRLPANTWVIQGMIDAQPWKDATEKYANFYEKNIKNRLAGYWNPNAKEFSSVDEWVDCWLADGNYAIFDENTWNCYNTNNDYFFSVCLLKN